jgi:SAM-dependent methyltransferase
MDKNLVEQLRRQSLWLKDSWLWLLREKVLDAETKTALEVGCGAGYVMEILSEHLEMRGLDNDPDMVSLCREKGLDVNLADVMDIPTDDESFDIVYCSFLLLWLPDPVRAVEEMARVSRRWVVCLAEPDYGARIDHPPELERLGHLLTEGLMGQGADPFIGRRLRGVFAEAGLIADIGVHQGVWPIDRTAREAEMEMVLADEASRRELGKALDKALAEGSLLQYNPVFYALARK